MLLDEPTSQLDPVAGDELIGLLRRLNEEWGTAVLLAEHRLERCLPAADRVIALADGRVACDAAPQAFLTWAPSRRRRWRRRARGCFAARRPRRRARWASRRRARRCAPHGALPSRRRRRAVSRHAPVRATPRSARRRCAFAASGSSRGRPAILRGVDLSIAAGRAGRADGPQRRRQVDAAAPRRRPASSRRAAGSRAGRPRRAAAAEPERLPRARAGRRTRRRRTRSQRSAWPRFADRHPRDLSGGERQRLALAIVLGGDEPRGPRCCASTSRRAAWTAPTRPSSPCCSAASRRPAPRCSSPRTTPSSPPRSPTASCCSATARRSPTAGRRGARRRLVLRHRDRAHPARRRRRARSRRRRRARASRDCAEHRPEVRRR